ncbi:metallophosphoesterase family protein [Ornithinibacillus halotolerans]|uniref:DNA repair exonuclease n=1 Tax=Ornithinibacillus halotolerans TaxID=1274357 RepID=A0A916W6W5_9BACI|nr:DNA repair exonuclease [Ornithinibacillus halotolerans]GGA73357.1 DNA repair exonuclease [Ornithinibacillus halotolerans]
MKISFIHAADLHLDSPFRGLAGVDNHLFHEIRQSTFHALDNLVNIAIKKKVDFILLVGDLFDNDKQSLKAQIKLRTAFEQLHHHGIQVYLSYGNHDYLSGNIYPITYPENVHIFNEENIHSFIYEKEKKPLAKIYGFSYEKRAVIERKIDQYTKSDPEIPFHIGMLHGSIESNTEHDTYAPFQINDLVEKDFNYWALGHIHKREILKENPFIIYPGNIQGRNRKEIGDKGCYYVELSIHDSQLEFIPLQAVTFDRLNIDITNCETIHQVEIHVVAELKKQNYQLPQLLELTLESKHTIVNEWKNEELLEDIIDIINESFMQYHNWIHIYRYSLVHTGIDKEKLQTGDHFIGELSQLIDMASVTDYLSEILQHKEARKYMDTISNEEITSIKKEAYELLVHELLKE